MRSKEYIHMYIAMTTYTAAPLPALLASSTSPSVSTPASPAPPATSPPRIHQHMCPPSNSSRMRRPINIPGAFFCFFRGLAAFGLLMGIHCACPMLLSYPSIFRFADESEGCDTNFSQLSSFAVEMERKNFCEQHNHAHQDSATDRVLSSLCT